MLCGSLLESTLILLHSIVLLYTDIASAICSTSLHLQSCCDPDAAAQLCAAGLQLHAAPVSMSANCHHTITSHTTTLPMSYHCITAYHVALPTTKYIYIHNCSEDIHSSTTAHKTNIDVASHNTWSVHLTTSHTALMRQRRTAIKAVLLVVSCTLHVV